MTFTLSALGASLADYLSPSLPGVSFYPGPNQQGTRTPAVFLRQTTAKIASHAGGRLLRKLGLDLIYLVDFNQVNMAARLQAAADTLDEILETFPYKNGGETALLRTYDRNWELEDNELHYKFKLYLWLTRREDAALMQSIEELRMEVIP